MGRAEDGKSLTLCCLSLDRKLASHCDGIWQYARDALFHLAVAGHTQTRHGHSGTGTRLISHILILHSCTLHYIWCENFSIVFFKVFLS